jgi:glycosyltransferase involved in cell wall biosynthesis
MIDKHYRVLYVENAHSVGGSVISIYRLVQKLDRQHFEPIVLFYRANAYEPRFRELGIEVIVLEKEKPESIPGGAGHSRDIAAVLGGHSQALADVYRQLKSIYLLVRQTLPHAWQIRSVIKSQGIDLVHLNNRLSGNQSAALAARFTGTPCICHVRDFDQLSWLDRWVAGRINYFVFMSLALEQNVRAAIPDLRGSVVYDGLELEPFLNPQNPAFVRRRFGLDEHDFVIGNVGRLVSWKGQEVFLRALARIAPQLPRLKALIVGEPDPPAETTYRQQLLDLTRQLDLADRVRFTGFASDIPAVMASLDILVHSSSSPEPFGIVIIEGMAAGKPVIATGAGGALDIIEHGSTGLLVPPGDDQAMAEALLKLARDPGQAVRLGAEARHRVLERFTVTQYAQTMQTIYQSLLEQDENILEAMTAHRTAAIAIPIRADSVERQTYGRGRYQQES